jgi:hypothetical protein
MGNNSSKKNGVVKTINVTSYRDVDSLLLHISDDNDKQLFKSYYNILLDMRVYASNFTYNVEHNYVVNYHNFVEAGETSTLRRYLSLNGITHEAQIGYYGDGLELLNKMIAILNKKIDNNL